MSAEELAIANPQQTPRTAGLWISWLAQHEQEIFLHVKIMNCRQREKWHECEHCAAVIRNGADWVWAPCCSPKERGWLWVWAPCCSHKEQGWLWGPALSGPLFLKVLVTHPSMMLVTTSHRSEAQHEPLAFSGSSLVITAAPQFPYALLPATFTPRIHSWRYPILWSGL